MPSTKWLRDIVPKFPYIVNFNGMVGGEKKMEKLFCLSYILVDNRLAMIIILHLTNFGHAHYKETCFLHGAKIIELDYLN